MIGCTDSELNWSDRDVSRKSKSLYATIQPMTGQNPHQGKYTDENQNIADLLTVVSHKPPPHSSHHKGNVNQTRNQRTDKIIIISCCASHHTDRPFRTQQGQPIDFFANPTGEHPGEVPDGVSDNPPQTWRDRLIRFNDNNGAGFVFSLYPASELYWPNAPYENVYTELAEVYEHMYVLSAGWGIIRKNFLIPNYDITFQANAENHKKRRTMWSDEILVHNFNHLTDDFGPNATRGKDGNGVPVKPILPIHFLGGTSYRKPFIDMTKNLPNDKIIRYIGIPPHLTDSQRRLNFSISEFASGRAIYQYTWVYQCAREEYLKDEI